MPEPGTDAAQSPSSFEALPPPVDAPAGPSTLVDDVAFRSDESAVLQLDDASPSGGGVPLAVQDPDGLIQLTSASSAPATFRLQVTDAPEAGVDAIYVKFSRIEMRNKESGERVTVAANPVEVNLLSLRDGVTRAFGGVSVPAGTYHQLRFYIESAAVQIGSERVSVSVSSVDHDDGLRIFGTLEVKEGATADMIIDFDASRCLVVRNGRFYLRAVAKLRHLHFNPAGIHLEEAADSLSLVGPVGSVRPRAYVQVTDQRGGVTRIRAAEDGSFRFSSIPRIYGQIEFAIVERQRAQEEHEEHEEHGEGNRWVKRAWVNFQVDFAADPKYPRILASNLNSIFAPILKASSNEAAVFLGRFKTDAFRFLAARYLQALGRSLPAGFVVPSLPVPYAFALEGPEYELPGYSFSQSNQNFYAGGPSGDGCSDASLLFAGTDPANDYAGLTADAALRLMLSRGLPFTGLLSEFEVSCRARDLGSLSCGTLGSLARPGSASLPSEALKDLPRALNSPRGGLIVSLLSCMESSPAALRAVPVPTFPTSGSLGCWYGCAGGPQEKYLDDSSLLAPGASDALITDPALVSDLDGLVSLAVRAGVAPLKLAASWVADHAVSRVHGLADRKAPALFNLTPVDQSETDLDHVDVSGLLDDRTVTQVSVNGVSGPAVLAPDGLVHFGPISVVLARGANQLRVGAADESGNSAEQVLHVFANLPDPEPSVTPSPSPSPTPSPTPTLVPQVDALCQAGEFVPKGAVNMALSIDPNEGSMATIVSGFQALGVSPTVYTNADIESGALIRDGINLLAISRRVTFAPLTVDYVNAVRAYVANGGSLIGEYDGAALVFSDFSGSNNIIMNLTPALQLFTGSVAGGGAVLPLTNSTTYITDPSDPLMVGMPASFLIGPRAAFAITGFNSNWLHTSATFTSVGTNGLVPAGTYPAVLSGRCGAGRVVLFTMTHFQIMQKAPVNLMVANAISWLLGH